MKKLEQFIANLWKKILAMFSKIPAEFKMAVHLGVAITENLKNFVESPIADVLTALIPGTVDDKTKDLLRTYLPVVFTELKLIDECKDLTDPGEIVRCGIRVLQGLNGEIKSAYLHSISVLLTRIASDGKLGWSDALYLSQWYYQNRFKQN